MLFQYEPELDAFLEFLIWRFSIWVDKPTPGNALMNLRYRDERAMDSIGKGRQVCTFHAYGVGLYGYVTCADLEMKYRPTSQILITYLDSMFKEFRRDGREGKGN
jgi:hypothetical protein